MPAGDSIEYLLGKISGQLDGMEQRQAEIKDVLERHVADDKGVEARVASLERSDARRGGMLASIAGIASIAGGGLVTFFARKYGGS
ncbi:MAG TPA: hypothetical protein VEC14_07860 [Reyranellaceae bacterium]|nr:hypothetical protein [Reyranellaceae bacterium]